MKIGCKWNVYEIDIEFYWPLCGVQPNAGQNMQNCTMCFYNGCHFDDLVFLSWKVNLSGLATNWNWMNTKMSL